MNRLLGRRFTWNVQPYFRCKILKQLDISSRIFSSASGVQTIFLAAAAHAKWLGKNGPAWLKGLVTMETNVGRLRRPPPLIQSWNWAIRNHQRLWAKYVAGLGHRGHQLLFGYVLWYLQLKHKKSVAELIVGSRTIYVSGYILQSDTAASSTS